MDNHEREMQPKTMTSEPPPTVNERGYPDVRPAGICGHLIGSPGQLTTSTELEDPNTFAIELIIQFQDDTQLVTRHEFEKETHNLHHP